MADVSPSGTRVVPVMAGPKYSPQLPQTPKETPRAIPRQSQPREIQSLWDDPECLKMPCLEALGLYASKTVGDGNCLYRALSDQMYGVFDHFEEIRNRLANHIQTHPEYFMNFMSAMGGERRAPRRAAAAASRSSSSSVTPTPASKEQQIQKFETRVEESRKNGSWGGSEEIQAFCQSYKRDVRVYMDSGIQDFRDVSAPGDEEREVVHIAFHNFYHYSSVRNINGPHTGLPHIPNSKATAHSQTDCGDAVKTNTENEESKDAAATAGPVVDVAMPWKISKIEEGLGGRYDRDTIVEMLQQCRGDIERAFVKLLDEDTSTDSSTKRSSSPATTVTDASSFQSVPPQPQYKQRLRASSRSSSRHSTSSKRSADDSDDEKITRRSRQTRGREQKRRILPNVTVGINLRDENQNDLVSLRLRVSPDVDAERADTAEPATKTDVSPEATKKGENKRNLRPRRSVQSTSADSSSESQQESQKQPQQETTVPKTRRSS
ncbi:hypothetical protein Plec18167_003898 [Paecilomyces lecythidis]|uniref:OTU domain-containing protein n=1 Tax=Paecilomyces lecythidis TaxID=3004212 RepID=A0ABR3XTX9_9EURO